MRILCNKKYAKFPYPPFSRAGISKFEKVYTKISYFPGKTDGRMKSVTGIPVQ